MMTRKQNIIFVYGLMNTAMCICMAATALIVNVGFLTLPMFIVTLAQALIICNLCTLIFRIPGLSSRGALILSGGRPDSKSFSIWNGLFNATLNTLFMNTFMTLINVGASPAYFPAWLHGFPALEVVAVAVSLVLAPFAAKLALSVDSDKTVK